MRTITSLLAAGLLACSMSAIAADERGSNSAATKKGSVVGEFGNECAWGLASGGHFQTNCSVNMTGENGKTYCFSSDKAMESYLKDRSGNLGKATKTYGR